MLCAVSTSCTLHTYMRVYVRMYVQMEVHVKQVEVKVEGESARPLIALIASASGSVSNWSTEVQYVYSTYTYGWALHHLVYE